MALVALNAGTLVGASGVIEAPQEEQKRASAGSGFEHVGQFANVDSCAVRSRPTLERVYTMAGGSYCR